MAGLRRQEEIPTSQLGTKKTDAFCKAIKQRLQNTKTNFSIEFLRYWPIKSKQKRRKYGCEVALKR
jgi:hypothetical protein